MAPHRPGNPQPLAAGSPKRAGARPHLEFSASPASSEPAGPGPHPSCSGAGSGRSVARRTRRVSATGTKAARFHGSGPGCFTKRRHDLAAHPRPRRSGLGAGTVRMACQLSCAPRGEPAQLGTFRCGSHHPRPGSAHGSRSPDRFDRRPRPALQLARHAQAARAQPLRCPCGNPDAFPACGLRIKPACSPSARSRISHSRSSNWLPRNPRPTCW